jgi:DNA polymerase III delta prime subunit
VIEHYLQLDGAHVVNTANFALALENMRYVRRRHAISLFFGDPGVGKTTAAQAIAESFDEGEGCVVKLTTAPNPRMIANAILERLTGVAHDETRWEAARTLTHELQERPRMVIIDEAQNAGLDCIEWLRWLHEEVPGRLTLLFVGGPQVRARVMKSPQLTRRIFQPTGFRALPAASVLATIRSFHPMYEAVDDELILDVDRRHCHGNFGHWAQLSITAFEMCQELGLKTITPKIANIAIRRNQELRDL